MSQDPNLFDYVPERRQRAPMGPRAQAYELASALVEMQAQRAADPNWAQRPELIREGNFSINLPPPDRRPNEVLGLDLYKALDSAGGGQSRHAPEKVVDFIQKNIQQGQRSRVFDELGSAPQRADFLNEKPVAPVEFEGGNYYNRYDVKAPHIAAAPQSPEDAALEKQRLSAAALDDTQRRVLTQKPVGRVKAKGPDGKIAYYDAFLGANGGTTYRPAVGGDGALLDADDTGPTSEMQNIGNRVRITGLSEQDVLEQMGQQREPSLRERARRVTSEILRDNPKLAKDPAKLRAEVNARLSLIDGVADAQAPRSTGQSSGAEGLAQLLDAINPRAAATDRTLAPFRQNAAPGVPKAPRTLPPPIPGPSAPAGVVMTDKSGRRVKSLGNGQWQPVP